MRNRFQDSGMFTRQANVVRPFKMSLEGFAGDGKSFTMAMMIVGIWKAEEKKRNVVLVDTERSAKFYAGVFEPEGLIEGQNFFVTASRSLVDWQKILKMCEDDQAIMATDTVTHLYEEMVRAYLQANKRKKVLVQDHGTLKPMWKERFATPYVNASCHCLFTGRAAWEYAMEENEETQKKEFYKSGVKMRGDNETAFESDLNILMQRVEKIQGRGVKVWRQAVILKDRSTLLDGKVINQDGKRKGPSFQDFKPVYEFLCAGEKERGAMVETSLADELRGDGDREWFENRRKAEIFVEEIEGLFKSYLPGQGPKEKKVQADIFYTVFQTRSMTALGELRAETLREGKIAIEHLLKHLTRDRREWLAKMQGDKEQAFDLAEYIREEFERFGAERRREFNGGGTERESDDQIPVFATPQADEGGEDAKAETSEEGAVQ